MARRRVSKDGCAYGMEWDWTIMVTRDRRRVAELFGCNGRRRYVKCCWTSYMSKSNR